MGRISLIALVLVVSLSGAVSASDDSLNAAEVGVIYFHGSQRCMTCMKLEELTVLAVQSEFKDLLEEGVLKLEVVNFHADGNEHFEEDFELEGQSVILISFENEKIVRWKNLEKIWDLVEDSEKFEAYIVEETNRFLEIQPVENE